MSFDDVKIRTSVSWVANDLDEYDEINLAWFDCHYKWKNEN